MTLLQAPRPISTATRPGAILAAMSGAFKTWNDGRATRKSLGKLSDQQLNDIGLIRGDLDSITRQT